MTRWTRFIVRNPKKVLVAWLIVAVVGGAGASSLGSLLTNRFSVPGSDAERGRDLLKTHFGERSDGAFSLVFQSTGGSTRDPAFVRAADRAAARAASVLPQGKAGPLQHAGDGVAFSLIFAAVTIPFTLGIVWIFAHFMNMATYVENIGTLIGLAIAIDYSMLVVFRYREELERHDHPYRALERTIRTAGRATLFSGLTVAVGLALLVLMPVPFMRSMGVGGLFVPLVSIAASATFLPALLATMKRGVNRWRIIPRSVLKKRAQGQSGFWTTLAHSIMRRPVLYCVASGGLMLALAIPALGLHLTGGDNRGVPKTTEATRGLTILENAVGAGALAPNEIVIDTGRQNGVWSRASVAAQRRFASAVRPDPEVVPATIQVPALA